MKRFFLHITLVLACVSALRAQTKYNLPQGAQIIETKIVTPRRTLVLWMQNPEKHLLEESGFYSCPDQTRGNYYDGELHVSLVNAETQKTISSIEIVGSDPNDSGKIQIPYLIRRFFYQVPIVNSKKEGKPEIMTLKDYNGDGRAREFALFDKTSCSGLDTSLIGYDQSHDKIVQYPIQLSDRGQMETVYWAPDLFLKKPISRGHWKYSVTYNANPDTPDKYEIHYDKSNGRFVGSIKSVNPGNE